MTDLWHRGDVVLQEGWNPTGKLVEVRPAIVVDDRAEYLALYFPMDSTWLSGDWMRGRNRYNLTLAERMAVFLSPDKLTLEPRVNTFRHVLSLLPPGGHHACWFFWDRDWRPTEWFVNLQLPFERTHLGIRVTDCYLDLSVTPDFQWTWKDVDEFEAICEAGVIRPDLRHILEAEAHALAGRIERREWPYSEDWASWRPEPDWPIPLIQHHWPDG